MINAGPCCRCKTDIYLPEALYEAAQKSTSITFYCPYGHSQIFAAGETEADKLRRERDRLAQKLAEKDDEIASQRRLREETERRLSAQKGQVTKLKKRAAAGTCPCCQRTFSNMASHMKNQHPEYVKDTGANVVPLKRESA